MRILMAGPGKGHNAKLFLDFFQKHHEQFDLTYIGYDKIKIDFSEYPNIRSILLRKELWKIFQLPHNYYDLIWLHNWTPIPLVLFLLKFQNDKTKINFNIWSEFIPKFIENKQFPKGAIYSYILKRCDFVQSGWYGTNKILEDCLPEANTFVIPWGFHPDFFGNKEIQHDYTRNFIDSLPDDKIKFLFPKSVSDINRHDLIIDAAKSLRNKGIEGFIVYFWLGSAVNKKRLSELKHMIRTSSLEKTVIIVDHVFIPFSDFNHIWNAMDCGLQILGHDLLSSSFYEPQYFQKELIASDLLPYRIYEERFGLSFDLIMNDVQELSDQMASIIKGHRTSSQVKGLRKKVVEENFNFEKNAFKMIEYFQKN